LKDQEEERDMEAREKDVSLFQGWTILLLICTRKLEAVEVSREE